jgi:hypothetical protein
MDEKGLFIAPNGRHARVGPASGPTMNNLRRDAAFDRNDLTNREGNLASADFAISLRSPRSSGQIIPRLGLVICAQRDATLHL